MRTCVVLVVPPSSAWPSPISPLGLPRLYGSGRGEHLCGLSVCYCGLAVRYANGSDWIPWREEAPSQVHPGANPMEEPGSRVPGPRATHSGLVRSLGTAVHPRANLNTCMVGSGAQPSTDTENGMTVHGLHASLMGATCSPLTLQCGYPKRANRVSCCRLCPRQLHKEGRTALGRRCPRAGTSCETTTADT